MIELLLGVAGPILAIALFFLNRSAKKKEKTVLEVIDEKKGEFDLYMANERYEEASYIASRSLANVERLLRKKRKGTTGK